MASDASPDTLTLSTLSYRLNPARCLDKRAFLRLLAEFPHAQNCHQALFDFSEQSLVDIGNLFDQSIEQRNRGLHEKSMTTV